MAYGNVNVAVPGVSNDESSYLKTEQAGAPGGVATLDADGKLSESQEDMNMKYDARACHFNMDTGCVELLLRDGRMISIDCTGVEDELDVTMAQRTELDYLIYNDPLGYADLILNGDPEKYLKNVAGSHGLED